MQLIHRLVVVLVLLCASMVEAQSCVNIAAAGASAFKPKRSSLTYVTGAAAGVEVRNGQLTILPSSRLLVEVKQNGQVVANGSAPVSQFTYTGSLAKGPVTYTFIGTGLLTPVSGAASPIIIQVQVKRLKLKPLNAITLFRRKRKATTVSFKIINPQNNQTTVNQAGQKLKRGKVEAFFRWQTVACTGGGGGKR